MNTMTSTRSRAGAAVLAGLCGSLGVAVLGCDQRAEPPHDPPAPAAGPFSTLTILGGTVDLPHRAAAPFRLRDGRSGVAAEIALVGAHDVEGREGPGRIVYPRGHPLGDLEIASSPLGVEDFVTFARRPPAPGASYELRLGERVAALRLVANTLELLDEHGAPRIRVPPPRGVDARGRLFAATLEVRGCLVDADPRPPWGRAVPRPGAERCVLRTTWRDEGLEYPLRVDPAWTLTGSLAVGREGFVAARLLDGRVLVAGGSALSPPILAEAEVYDPATGTWAVTGSMGTARANFSVIELSTGEALVAGGYVDLNGTVTATCEIYTPATGKWSPTGTMSKPRSDASTQAVTVPGAGQRFLIAGGASGSGSYQSTAELYDPVSGTWTPTGAMSVARTQATMNALPSGLALVTGGFGGAILQSAETYDPATQSWTSTGQMMSARYQHSAVVLPGGDVLVAGGQTPSVGTSVAVATAERYHAGQWTSVAPMHDTRTAFSAVLLPNAQVLAIGGSFGMSSQTTTHTELFDPAQGTWTPAGDLTTGRTFFRAFVLQDGRTLAISGATNPMGMPGASLTPTAELYGVATPVDAGAPDAAADAEAPDAAADAEAPDAASEPDASASTGAGGAGHGSTPATPSGCSCFAAGRDDGDAALPPLALGALGLALVRAIAGRRRTQRGAAMAERMVGAAGST
jgi:hypothetical protein